MEHQARHYKRTLQPLKQTLEALRRSLEELESALIEFEEDLGEEAQQGGGLDLLSITDVCKELGMGKSWVYMHIRSGEIPSVKLGSTIKVRREDLEGYLGAQRYQPRS